MGKSLGTPFPSVGGRPLCELWAVGSKAGAAELELDREAGTVCSVQCAVCWRQIEKQAHPYTAKPAHHSVPYSNQIFSVMMFLKQKVTKRFTEENQTDKEGRPKRC